MLGTDGPTLILYDLIQGVRHQRLPVSHSHFTPRLEPRRVTDCICTAAGAAASDMEFKNGEIVQVDFNEDSLTLENEVVLKTVIRRTRISAYSPDGTGSYTTALKMTFQNRWTLWLLCCARCRSLAHESRWQHRYPIGQRQCRRCDSELVPQMGTIARR